MVAGLRDEPGSFPSGDAVGFVDELGEIFLIKIAGKSAGGVALVGVGFALMPEDGPKAVWPEGAEAISEFVKEEAFAFPFTIFEFDDFVEDGGRIGEAGSFG